MTPRAFCQPGSHERVKTAVHVAALAIAGACFAYNASAWCFRRQRHLAINTLVYGALVAFEAVHVRHHLESR